MRRRASITLLVGSMGCGKTHKAKTLANSCRKSVWVWDAVGEWTQDRLLPRAACWPSLEAYRVALEQGQRPPLRNVVLSSRKEWPAFASFAYRSCELRGGGMVVLEELPRYVRSRASTTGWLDMVDRARHAGVDLLCLGPRLMAFPVEVRAQASQIIVFRTTDPDSLSEIRRRSDAATADRVARLGKWKTLTIET